MAQINKTTLLLWYPVLVLSNGFIAVELMRRLDAFEEDCPNYFNDDKCNSPQHLRDDPSGNIGTIGTKDGPTISYEKQNHIDSEHVKTLGYVAIGVLSLVIVLWGVLVGILIKRRCMGNCNTDQKAMESDQDTYSKIARFLAIIAFALTVISMIYVFYFNDTIRNCASNEWATSGDNNMKTKESQYHMVSDIACISIGLTIPSTVAILYNSFFCNDSVAQEVNA
mmetsp:Transcript_4033/g.6211  ORF Transcript_4033/g.6211 Transcript_4033/m.6211 type:complete len:224 (+) Transcript_4033:201-872(+)